MRLLLQNAHIITGKSSFMGSVGIDGESIAFVQKQGKEAENASWLQGGEALDLKGLALLPGVVDAHVHFREPGYTHKANIESESKAALLGGVCSFMDMPNTKPPTVSEVALDDKLNLAENRSWADYGFHLGATNDNIEELLRAKRRKFAGIKLFMCSSTGNMSVRKEESLKNILSIKDKPVLIHSEDQAVIDANSVNLPVNPPFSVHPLVRSRDACVKSTIKALELAVECGTRLHVCHVSTAEEVRLIRAAKQRDPLITAETSANYLWFSDEDYSTLGGKIKCNPAIKSAKDRQALLEGLQDGSIDSIGSDHAPHLPNEKQQPYLLCPSGIPSVQQQLSVMISIAANSGLSMERIVSAMSEKPAEIMGLTRKGHISPGFDADFVIVDLNEKFMVDSGNSKCGWNPYEGEELCGKVKMVFLRGQRVVRDGKLLLPFPTGKPLQYKSLI